MKLPTNIPTHPLSLQHSKLHRDQDQASSFGYHQLAHHKRLNGFEVYSTQGMIADYGPAKSTFYRFGIVLKGRLHMQLGLEHFEVTAPAINFSIPGQVHAKSDVSEDILGYYVLFQENFIENLLPAARLQQEFPFFSHSGHQCFHCRPDEIEELSSLIQKINDELQEMNTGREMAIKMYLYLMLLTAKRSYERQQLSDVQRDIKAGHPLVTQFHKLVGQHFLHLRQVSDYAALLNVTPNHLNRTVKTVTNRTASDAISEMLAQEAKVLLRSTILSAAEIAYQLNFSEPAAFSHFFKKMTGTTPLSYRQRENKLQITASDQ